MATLVGVECSHHWAIPAPQGPPAFQLRSGLLSIDCAGLFFLSSRKAASHRSSSVSTSSFRRSLLDAILDVLRKTPCAVSSGAVHWLFKLLTGFAAQADSTLTSFVCLELLEFLSTKLNAARLREHLSLRSR